MVIVELSGGLGNQFGQYVAGRLLAYKLNTELKLDTTNLNTAPEFRKRFHVAYRLGDFNIVENFATPEEIKRVKEKGMSVKNPLPNLDNFKGDIYMRGQWPRQEEYFSDIINIVRKEFTLKKPFSSKAESWKQKILSAECSVAMHFRHGDFAYNPNLISQNIKKKPWFNIMPLDYYYTCIDILKQRYNTPPTAFVFSDNLSWVKENLHLDVPTEFIEGVETDNEEFILMSLCKHLIKPNSSFSEYAASLNANPDKKIFSPRASTAEEVQRFLNALTPASKNALLDTKGWILVPFDYYNQPEIKQRPIFSLLLVVNNDAANLHATFDGLLNQNYKYYEVVIIDNASTDGSNKICQDAVANKKNVTLKRLETKVSNAVAWNEAFKAAQGKYVSFLKAGDRFLANSLKDLYCLNEYRQVDIINMFAWLKKDSGGNVTFVNEKFSVQRDTKFKEEKRGVIMSEDGCEAARLLLNRQINPFLGTKLYNVEFLKEYKIKFDEQLDDKTAELFFQTETFFKSKDLMYISNVFYVVPPPPQVVMEYEHCLTARIDIQLVPKTQGDFQILSVSDKKADVKKPAWLNKNGVGYMIHSYAGKLEIIAKSAVDGQINLYPRGLDVRTPEDYSKRIPCWIDYTKLIINGQVIFDKIIPAWHDKPYVHRMDVKAGVEIKIQVEWLPHKSDI